MAGRKGRAMNRKERKARIREKQLERENSVLRTAEYAEDAERRTGQKAESGRQEAGGGKRNADFERETKRCARAMTKAREFKELCKRNGIKLRPAGLRNVNWKIAPSQMVWRRVTSMTLPLEPFMDADERRAGLERLMKWLEKACLNRRDAEAQRTEEAGSPSPCGRGLGGGVGSPTIHETATPLGSPDPSPYPLPHAPSPGYGDTRGERENNSGASRLGRLDAGGTAGGTPALREQRDDRMILSDWNSDLSTWQRVKTDGHSIEAVCASLGLSRWKLTQLTKEYCNLTATELFDGFKVSLLKKFMCARLRDAARQLWGIPGHYAQFKAQGYLDCESAPLSRGQSLLEDKGRRDAGDTAGRMPALRMRRKQSKFFPATPRDLFLEEKGPEKARRVTALIEKMWKDFDFESWAISAGYSSAARLKRAVLNRLGKSFGQLEKCLAGEVIDYYQCAEDRELRNIALREDNCDAILDARRLYHKSDERPSEPFLDMWSAALFGAKAWLEKMAGAFG